MTKYINSNVSIDEFFKYHCEDDNAIRFYNEICSEGGNYKQENERLERRIEGLLEQNFNAVETIDAIENIVKHYSAKDGAVTLKKWIIDAIQESSFER